MQNDGVDDATRRLEAARAVEISPAQPDDADRVDPSDISDADTTPPHVKHERGPKMEH